MSALLTSDVVFVAIMLFVQLVELGIALERVTRGPDVLSTAPGMPTPLG